MPFDGSEFHADDQILRVIDRVDELICDEEHWWQASRRVRIFNDNQISHCPVTAIKACGCDYLCGPEIGYIHRALQDITDDKSSGIPCYNNDPERKFSEIQALIAKARQLRLADIAEKVAA